jgi:hypothetical protein
LFFKTFGYKTDAFNPQFNKVYGVNPNYRAQVGKHGSAYYAQDVVGRDFFLPIEVVVGADNAETLGVTDGSGNVTGVWQLPYPVMAVDLQKHFVDTQLTERNGIVSELINSGNYKFNIKGFLIDQGGDEYPEDDMDTLQRLANINAAVRINNPVSDLCFAACGNSAKTVTIRNLRVPENKGVKHVRVYELELLMNMPFNLIEIS